MPNWFVAADGKSLGAFTLQQIISGLASDQYKETALVWRGSLADWQPADSVAELQSGQAAPAPPPPPASCKEAHEIDYAIFGNEMQFVEIELAPQERVISEAGAMMCMHDQVAMETVFGDGSRSSSSGSFFDKMLGADKRLITGEGLFITMFTGSGKGKAAFAARYPGKTVPLDLSKYNGRIICRKDAFLCTAKGVSLGIAFQKKNRGGHVRRRGFFSPPCAGRDMSGCNPCPSPVCPDASGKPHPRPGAGGNDEGSVLGGLANIFER